MPKAVASGERWAAANMTCFGNAREAFLAEADIAQGAVFFPQAWTHAQAWPWQRKFGGGVGWAVFLTGLWAPANEGL